MLRRLIDWIAKLFGYTRRLGIESATCELALVADKLGHAASLGVFVSTMQRPGECLVVFVDWCRVEQVAGSDYITISARIRPVISADDGTFALRPDLNRHTPSGLMVRASNSNSL